MKRRLVVTLLALVGLGLGVFGYPYVVAEDLGPMEVPPIDVAALSARVQASDLSPTERVWERIPWTRTLEEAQALSARTERPIFLFSMWGELDSRC